MAARIREGTHRAARVRIPRAEVAASIPAATSSLVAECVGALSAYESSEPAQRQLRTDFLDHLSRRPDGWSRACAGAHLTASSLLCSATADEVLLVHHGKLRRWLQTGGHIEPTDPTPAAAALREAREESGLGELELVPGIVHLDRHAVPCGPVRPCFHLDLRYLVLADPSQPVPGSAESVAARWFSATALPTAEPSVTALVELARARFA